MKKHAEQEEQRADATVSTTSGSDSGKKPARDAAGDAANGAETTITGAEAEPGDAEKGSAAEESAKAPSAAGDAGGLTARIAELEKLNADLQDQYLRKAGDFDNYRKRMIREKQDAIDYANASLLTDLVQVLDDFDRAIEAGGVHEEGSPAAAFANGVSMIRGQLAGMLESKYALSYYPAKGASFDPNLHEAIATAPSPDVTEATVAEEYVKGYKLRDRILRHSKVMVHTPAANGQ